MSANDQMANNDDLLRLAALYERSLTATFTDEEMRELETLETRYPDWHPGDLAEIPPPIPTPDAPIVVRPEYDEPIELRPETFTNEELEKIARWHHTTVPGLQKRWIVQYENSFYILGPVGEYTKAISRSTIDLAIEVDLARVPSVAPGTPTPPGWICWQKRVNDNVAKKTFEEFRRDYVSAAHEVVTSMLVERSYYNQGRRIFYERACPQAKLQPTFHAEIDEWLTLLGGDRSVELKNWIAAATQLDKPVCALYVHGPASVGKTLLAHGLARLWNGVPVKIDSVTASFNSAIAKNPVVLADEHIPHNMTSGTYCEFVGNNCHSLRRKGIPESEIFGFYRLIIAANHPNLLKFEREDLNHESTEAVAMRTLYIQADPRAAQVFAARGWRVEINSWVEENKIAEHALWLRYNQQIVQTSRYLIEGKVGDAHRHVATDGSLRWLILELICKTMLGKNTGVVFSNFASKDEGSGIMWGGGHIFVNASHVKDTWEAVLGDKNVPSLNKIGRALKPLAVVGENGTIERRFHVGKGRRQVDFYNISVAEVLDAVERLQIGTREQVQALIDAPRAYMTKIDGGSESKPSAGLFETRK